MSTTRKQFFDRRDELANRANEARIMLANNSLVPFEGNVQSETDAVLLAQQGQMRNLDTDALEAEIDNETGHGLNMLAYYPAIDTIFDLILPPGVSADVLYKSDLLETVRLSTSTMFNRASGTASDGFARVSTNPAVTATPTPDKLNKLVGYIKLDERVMVQLSIAAALVVGNILENVPSHEVQADNETFQTKRVYYYEDLVKYIHSKYSDIITLDTTPGDAFENMSGSEVNNFARSLLAKYLKKADSALYTKSGTSKIKNSITKGTYGIEGDGASITLGSTISFYYDNDTYEHRVDSMLKVGAQNVGKVWQSKSASANKAAKSISGAAGLPIVLRNEMLHTARAIYIGTRDVVRGYSNIAFGTKIKTGDLVKVDELNVIEDLVISILSLVALHVITYSLSYAVDAYIRLAIRGAVRNTNGEIEFKGIDGGEEANVITPQMIFPGIKAALEMYNMNPRDWDRKVAFHLHTNPAVMSLFKQAKDAYDMDTSRPGIKGFRNAKAEDPTWMKDRATQRELEEYYAKAKGRVNNVPGTTTPPDPADGSTGGTPMGRTLGIKNTKNIVNSVKNLRGLVPEVDELNRIAGRDLINVPRNGIPVAFGKARRRRHRSSSFGKRKQKRRSSSFGKKTRKGRRSSSFGKKTRKGSRRSSAFGKKKGRKSHRKH